MRYNEISKPKEANEKMIIPVAPGGLAQAIAALPADDGTPVTLRLAEGEYREKCTLSRANTTIEGAGADRTRIVWDDGAFVILPDGMKRGTFRTATLLVDAPHVTIQNLTVENDAQPRSEVGQAVALYVDADDFRCEDCRLIGHQDTLFTAPLPPKEIEPNGFIGPKQHAPRIPQRHQYRRCLIEGNVDFIFGGAAAWFEDCEIRSVDEPGYVTAASTPEGQKYGYVFHRCRFTHNGLEDGCTYLGRPWRNFAKTVLLNCELGSHIHPAGFHDWGKMAAHETMLSAEHGSCGPGAAGERADYVKKLSEEEAAAITFEDFWHNAI